MNEIPHPGFNKPEEYETFTTTNDLDFEQELYNRFGQIKDFTLGMRIGQYFYELGKQSSNSETPNDLEEAAVDIADGLLAKPKDYALSAKADYWNGVHDGVIAGAKWQKEQMLKEAVECYYGYVNNCTKVFLPEETLKGVKEGYVRIVILKNDE